jgi:glycosyltransferase involved in cell wall biosynthesis
LVRLATAFKAVIERAPTLTTCLVLAGKRGWLTDPIDQGLQALGLGDRLLMPGHVPLEDLPALLHGARTVAYVSLYEGFGLPPLEAMACGAAVIASNNSSIPEVVGDAGLLVDPYDVTEIATALERVLTDDGLRAELAARGLRRAAQFSWTKTAELTIQTYRRAAATGYQQRAWYAAKR